jgi:hypothetical protein
MEAGITDHVWSLEELVALVPEPVAKPSTIEHDMVCKALAASA